ncbi:MAG: zinc metalloprotease HtpX [Nanoarchaeota archaeon]|nr:zinc metalloprotease HtpX [Nanoarchaeota archaeon]
MKQSFYSQIASNKRRTFFLIFFFIVVVIGLGYIFSQLMYWGWPGIILISIFAIIFPIISYYNSDKVALAVSKAKPARKPEHAHLINTVEGLAIAAGIPIPRVYVIEDAAPNAFATGRDPQHSAIAVTTGLLQKMDRYELEGVIAHEMSHIKNYDIRVMTIVVMLVGIVAILSNVFIRSLWFGGGRSRDNRGGGNLGMILMLVGIALAILSPLIAQLIKFAISRKREYLADASGAMLTRHPSGLASALKKIAADHNQLKTATNATAHLFISNPFKKKSFSALFSTHPPIEERVKRLEEM